MFDRIKALLLHVGKFEYRIDVLERQNRRLEHRLLLIEPCPPGNRFHMWAMVKEKHKPNSQRCRSCGMFKEFET